MNTTQIMFCPACQGYALHQEVNPPRGSHGVAHWKCTRCGRVRAIGAEELREMRAQRKQVQR